MVEPKHPYVQAFDDAIAAVRGCQLAFEPPTRKYKTMYDAAICQFAADLRSRRDTKVAQQQRKTSVSGVGPEPTEPAMGQNRET